MTPELLLTALVMLPGFAFATLALVWLLGLTPSERFIARVTALVYGFTTCALAVLAWLVYTQDLSGIHTPTHHWFASGSYHFDWELVADRLSLPLLMLTSILVGLVGVFSVRYVHRDRGYFRFFLLLHLFAFGALLVLSAGTYDMLMGGWELVGISSVLLIAYFDERREPVRNAVRVFAFYRLSDLGLLLGIFFLHTGGSPTVIGLLLLVAAAGKSAQAPFSGWLPRAMEGPTPSSAIFYGSISVHLGAYLLLRAEPLYRDSPIVWIAIVLVGGVTAVLATFVHRAATDAKTSLAYAGMAQLGLIFVEIGLGLPTLALFHIMGHAVVRTLQFLRAPSMLHDYHRVHAAAGGQLGKTGAHYERLLPEGVRLWLYRAAVERGYYDGLLHRLVIAPVLAFARFCEALEPQAEEGGATNRRLAEGIEN